MLVFLALNFLHPRSVLNAAPAKSSATPFLAVGILSLTENTATIKQVPRCDYFVVTHCIIAIYDRKIFHAQKPRFSSLGNDRGRTDQQTDVHDFFQRYAVPPTFGYQRSRSKSNWILPVLTLPACPNNTILIAIQLIFKSYDFFFQQTIFFQ